MSEQNEIRSMVYDIKFSLPFRRQPMSRMVQDTYRQVEARVAVVSGEITSWKRHATGLFPGSANSSRIVAPEAYLL